MSVHDYVDFGTRDESYSCTFSSDCSEQTIGLLLVLLFKGETASLLLCLVPINPVVYTIDTTILG